MVIIIDPGFFVVDLQTAFGDTHFFKNNPLIFIRFRHTADYRALYAALRGND